MSYYLDPDEVADNVSRYEHEIEVPCHRCYGLGDDEDGLPCMDCDGMGSNIVRY